MKSLFTALLCLMLISAFWGCGKKAEEGQTSTPAHGQAEEMADTTRMDSAMMDTSMMDTMTDTTQMETGSEDDGM